MRDVICGMLSAGRPWANFSKPRSSGTWKKARSTVPSSLRKISILPWPSSRVTGSMVILRWEAGMVRLAMWVTPIVFVPGKRPAGCTDLKDLDLAVAFEPRYRIDGDSALGSRYGEARHVGHSNRFRSRKEAGRLYRSERSRSCRGLRAALPDRW